MTIKEISKDINLNAHAHGFWDEEIYVPLKLMLIVSEVSEAFEAYRSGAPLLGPVTLDHELNFKELVNDSFEDELADVVIRVFDLAFELGIDLEKHIEMKHEYNKTRPYKHGKKF